MLETALSIFAFESAKIYGEFHESNHARFRRVGRYDFSHDVNLFLVKPSTQSPGNIIAKESESASSSNSVFQTGILYLYSSTYVYWKLCNESHVMFLISMSDTCIYLFYINAS